MATNVFNGREAVLQVSTTSTGTGGNSFGAVRSFTLTINRPEIDVGHFDSSGYIETLPGMAKGTLTAETLFLSTAATSQQDELRGYLSSGTRRYFFVKNTTGTNSQTFKGWGFVTNFEWSGDLESPQLSNFQIAFDGKVTEA